MFDFSQVNDFVVESGKVRMLNNYTFQDLGNEGIELFDFNFNLLFFDIVACFSSELCNESLTEVRATVKELLERFFEFFLVQEGDVIVLVEEGGRGGLDFVHVP